MLIGSCSLEEMIRCGKAKKSKRFTNQSNLEKTLHAADGSGKLFTAHSDVTQQFLEENVEKSISLTKTVRQIVYITQC